jgi:SNF2 family DNA or RNA helicase
MELKQLASRIKGSRLVYLDKTKNERLYFRYGLNNRYVTTTAYLQVINDKITPVVRVENKKHRDYFDHIKEQQYKDDILRQFHELINDCELERRKVPLHDRLKDDIIPVYSEDSLLHQVNGLRFLCTMKVSALFADTGTGKTKIAIDLANSRFEAGQIKKAVVFCPVSTKKNFGDEIKKWCTNDQIQWRIVGHESMGSSDRIFLETIDWINHETMIIVDESHLCKTPTAKRSKRILACCQQTSYKLIMTGTPTENVRDIYMQYTLLSELITGCRNWIQFEERYLILGGPSGDEVIGYKNLDHLMGLIEPYTYQIRKEDCLHLPAKTHFLLTCNLNDCQSAKYEETKEELLKEIENEFVSATTIFMYLTRLQQIACGFYKDPRTGEVRDLGSYKQEIIETTGYKNGQTIFFCKYLFEIDRTLQWLGRENCAVFSGQNPKERDFQKDLFTRREKQFFVATMGAGGTGLNGLQGCQRVLFISNSYKWTERKQCIGRIDRQGQLKAMFVFDTITESGIDYRIRQNLLRKGNLADEIRQLLLDKTKLKQYVQSL